MLELRAKSRKFESMLTAKKVERTKGPGRYHDGHGLYLQVVNANNKSWLLRYERNGRERWFGLGPAHTFSLKEARERARAARQLLHDDIDPIDHRKAQRAAQAAAKAKAITFAEAARRYFDQHEGKWRNAKHRAQFLSTLKTYAYPVVGNMAVADIDTPAVLRAVEPIWLTKTETASRVRGRIENVLDWCTVRGYRSGDNPARWKGHLAEVLPARGQVARPVHHAAMPYRELPAFMAALRARQGTAARALEFAILTAARTGEVIGARWSEIDIEDKTWTVPAGRMKGGKEYRVALSERAIDLLRDLPTEDNNGFIFVGPRAGSGLSNMAMAQTLKRMGHGDITVHGFRSSFRDWAAETTAFPNHVVEMALAHVVGDKVESAYRRGDLLAKRRQLAEAWSRYCTSPPMPAQTGKTVVGMRKGAASHA
jgi:integrase